MLTRKVSNSRRWRRQIGQCNAVHSFPIVGRHHFNRVPGTAIKKCAIRSFADAFLAADAEIRIHFDAPEWRMIFVWYPEHAGFDWTVFDTCRRACATSTTIRRDSKNARLLLTCGFAVAYRHGPLFFYDIVHRAVDRIQKSGFRSRNKTNASQSLEPS